MIKWEAEVAEHGTPKARQLLDAGWEPVELLSHMVPKQDSLQPTMELRFWWAFRRQVEA